jgi:hypothetical protein
MFHLLLEIPKVMMFYVVITNAEQVMLHNYVEPAVAQQN